MSWYFREEKVIQSVGRLTFGEMRLFIFEKRYAFEFFFIDSERGRYRPKADLEKKKPFHIVSRKKFKSSCDIVVML